MNLVDELNALKAAIDRIQVAAEQSENPPARQPSNRKKLTAHDVARIRELYATGNFRITELADDFDVHHATIGRIVRGVYWR